MMPFSPAASQLCDSPISPMSASTAVPTFEEKSWIDDMDQVEKGQDSLTCAPVSNLEDRHSLYQRAIGTLYHSIQRASSYFQSRNGEEDEEQTPPPRPFVRSLNDFVTGYPQCAALLDSSENFMIYRRFGYLQARLLLEKQDELTLIEQEIDDYDHKHEDQLLTRRTLEEPDATGRKDLIDRAGLAFTSYSSLMKAAHDMVSLYKPSDSEYRSVSRFLHNEKPVHKKERAWIQHREDLITLRPGREHAWLDRAIESVLNRLHKPFPSLNRLFSSETTRLKNQGGTGNEVYYSPERINMCASLIITMMILALLIVPIYLLFRQASSTSGDFTSHTTALCIGILLVSTLAFSAVLSLFTRAKRHEILGAAAAYCAVLVVFLGNVN